MELRRYQQLGAEFLLDAKRAVLADEMGVGKTPQLITASRGNTLVVAPPSLHSNWEREIARWGDGNAELTVTSYHGLVDRTRKDGNGKVLGVPVESLRGPWDTLVFDEAHHLKGRNTGYAKAGVRLCSETDRVYLATGTPVRNWASEVFMLLRALHPRDPRFSSYWRWVDRWFTVHNTERRVKGGKKVSTRSVGELRDVTSWETFAERNGLGGHWLRRELSSPEVDLELPPVNHVKLLAPLQGHHRNVYRSMENRFFAEWDGKALVAGSNGSQWSNLMRLSSGIQFHPEFAGDVASSKLDLLSDLVSGNEGPFLVFTWYRHSAEVLAEWFQHRGYRAESVHGGDQGKAIGDKLDRFVEGKTQVLVGTYSVLSEGHTFVNCNKTILFETPVVPATVDQAVGRTSRFGQTNSCTVWTLVTEGTVEEFFVDKVLPHKRSQSEALVSAAELLQYRGFKS